MQDHKAQQEHQDSVANLVQLVHKALEVNLVHGERQELQVPQDRQVREVNLDLQDHLGQVVQQDHEVNRDSEENLDKEGKVEPQGHEVNLDREVKLELLEALAVQVNVDKLDQLDLQALLDLQDLLDQEVKVVQEVAQDCVESLEHQVLQVGILFQTMEST